MLTEFTGIAITALAVYTYIDSNKPKYKKPKFPTPKQLSKTGPIVIDKEKVIISAEKVKVVKTEAISNGHLKSPHEKIAGLPTIANTTISTSNVNPTNETKTNNINISAKSTKAAENKTLLSLLKKVCEEFESLNYTKNKSSKKFSDNYTISKQGDGKWFKCSRLGLHNLFERDYLDLSKMPNLKELTDLIDSSKPIFKISGGRIFITEKIVYRIKNGKKHKIKTNFEDFTVFEKNLYLVQKAIDEKKSITFDYTNKLGNRSHRTVKPQRFNKGSGENICFEGYCNLRSEDRTFLVKNMRIKDQ